jgi:hypothetical protein
VFCRKRLELWRHHIGAARHAPAERQPASFRRPFCTGTDRRLDGADSLSRRAPPAADGCRDRTVRHALRAVDALDRRQLLRRPVLDGRLADGGLGDWRGRLSTYLALQPTYGGQVRLVAVAPMAVGLLLATLAWSRVLALSFLLLAAMGAAILISVNTTNWLLQQSVPDAWRGRVIGVYSMAFAGTAPIGGLIAGWLAEHIGLRATLRLNGMLIIAAGLLWRLHDHPEALRGLMRASRAER